MTKLKMQIDSFCKFGIWLFAILIILTLLSNCGKSSLHSGIYHFNFNGYINHIEISNDNTYKISGFHSEVSGLVVELGLIEKSADKYYMYDIYTRRGDKLVALDTLLYSFSKYNKKSLNYIKKIKNKWCVVMLNDTFPLVRKQCLMPM